MYRKEDEVFYALSPEEIVSCLIFGEARGEPKLGQEAVVHCVRNRVARGGWYFDKEILPKGKFHAVILKNTFVKGKYIYQFSCFQDGDPNRDQLLTMATHKKLPGTYQAKVFLENPEDVTLGATNYYATWMKTPPIWAKEFTETVRIGQHIFLK